MAKRTRELLADGIVRAVTLPVGSAPLYLRKAAFPVAVEVHQHIVTAHLTRILTSERCSKTSNGHRRQSFGICSSGH